MSLATVPKDDAMVYLHEAAHCYIYGLFQAAIALARAAVEASIRHRAKKLLGAATCGVMTLAELLDDRRLARMLHRDVLRNAEKVRNLGNGVLHDEPLTADDALSAVEAARSVLGSIK
jgi:hypothetical protein